MASRRRPTPAELDEARLRELALAALARRALTTHDLRRHLERAIDRWVRAAAREGRDEAVVAEGARRSRERVEAVVSRFGEVRLVDDASFAAARTRRLAHEGKSRRAIAHHLGEHGVDEGLAETALREHGGDELTRAVAFARRRRLGPYARAGDGVPRDQHARERELGAFARAGFDFETARRALAMDRERADELLAARD